ncbi:DUF1800 domain-containing protein [Elioraea sp.]|uniref:DUF1800 domain-containing protein n=1 Tax=Elioraea sp. TaxID=2185103 RepID=UPI003F72244B
MSRRDAAIAAIRFGLGPAPAELAALGADPRGWLAAQLESVPAPPAALDAAVPDAAAALQITLDAQRNRRPPGTPNPIEMSYRAAMTALTGHWCTTEAPLVEHLALFWSNHLTVSRRGGNTAAMVADHHLRAVRPHVLGPFRDLLLAAIRHPAMLRYLDNAASIGPNSPSGQRRQRGLNENLAREILELHTLSPAGGYSQADVTALAAILTGWGTGTPDPAPFVFRPRTHEPGPKTLLGRVFAEGELAGIEALTMLARHPATYRFLATKLVRHFVADQPPEPAVAAVARRLAETDGHLGAAMRTLIARPEPWAIPLGKLRTPTEYVIAVLRATGAPLPPRARVDAHAALGQSLFAAPAPDGWPDVAEAWAAPEAILRRIDWAGVVAARLATPPDPRLLLDETLGPLADAATMRAVVGAPTVREGVLLVLAAPGFQRR